MDEESFDNVPFYFSYDTILPVSCAAFSYKLYTYAPDNEWFIETMNTVFSVGGDVMQPDIPNSFLKLLSEGEMNTAYSMAVLFLILVLIIYFII